MSDQPASVEADAVDATEASAVEPKDPPAQETESTAADVGNPSDVAATEPVEDAVTANADTTTDAPEVANGASDPFADMFDAPPAEATETANATTTTDAAGTDATKAEDPFGNLFDAAPDAPSGGDVPDTLDATDAADAGVSPAATSEPPADAADATGADATATTETETSATTASNAENSQTQTLNKLEEELGRRPSVAEIEISAMTEDEQKKDIDKEIVKSNLEFALTMRPDADSQEVKEKEVSSGNVGMMLPNSGGDNGDETENEKITVNTDDPDSTLTLPQEQSTNPEISPRKANELAKTLSSANVGPSMVNNNITINKNNLEDEQKVPTASATGSMSLSATLEVKGVDDEDENKDDEKEESQQRTSSRRTSRILYVDPDSDDENGTGNKAEEVEETNHYDDSNYYKDLSKYTPNPDGEMKPAAYMSDDQFDKYMQSRRTEALQRQLKRRPSQEQLVAQHILQYTDNQVAASLQANAQSLQRKLQRRPSLEQPQLASIMKTQEERKKQMHTRKESLAQDLSNRATFERLKELGVLSADYGGMAPMLQNRAEALQSQLAAANAQQYAQATASGAYSSGLAPRLQDAAQQLDRHRRQDSLSAALTNPNRPNPAYLQSLGILPHQGVASRIQPQLTSLEAQLLAQQRLAAQSQQVASGQDQYWDSLAPRLQQNAMALFMDQRRVSLKHQLQNRPERSMLQDRNILLYNEGVAIPENNASDAYAAQRQVLAQQLQNRPSVVDVQSQGLMLRPNLSNNLQPTAETIEQFLKTLKPEQQLKIVQDERFRNDMAPSIMAAARALEAKKRKEQLARNLDQRMDKQELIDQGVLRTDPTQVASSLAGTGAALEPQLQQRVSSRYLAKQGILPNPTLDPSLQNSAHKLDQHLRMRDQNSNPANPASSASNPISPRIAQMDRSLQGTATELVKRQRRDTLTAALNARPDRQSLIDSGYMAEFGDKMAASLQPTAAQLEEQLQYQVSIEFLKKKGVMEDYDENNVEKQAPSRQELSELLQIEAKKDANAAIASDLEAVAQKLEASMKKDAVSQGLKDRPTAEEAGVDTSVAPQLQHIMRSLENAQKKDIVSKNLQSRGDAEAAGVDPSVAPSLQATAKQLESAQKKDAVSSGLQERGTAEDAGVETSIAASLQATAKMLEAARKRDAISKGLQQRSSAVQVGLDPNMAASLQAVAKQLEIQQKQLAIKQQLQSRPDAQELIDQNVLYATNNTISPNLQGTSADLREQLGLRVSQQYMQTKGLMLNPQLSNSLQPVAGDLQQMLINRPNTAPLQGADGTVAPSLQAAAKELEYKQKMLLLNRGLQSRSTPGELRDANILKFDAQVAQGLQQNAQDLQQSLAQQVSRGYLQSAGILQYNDMANTLQPTANMLNAQLLGRPKTAPGYYSDSLAPTLHSAAKKLDRKKKQEKLKKKLQQRANREWLAKKGFIDPREDQAEPKKKKKKKRKLRDANQRRMSVELDRSLANRPNPDQLVAQNILYSNPTLASGVTTNLQAQAKQLEAAKRRQQLSSLLQSRPDLQYLVDSGVVSNAAVASALAGNAADLESALKTQVARQYLEQQGILENPNIDPRYQGAASEISRLLREKQGQRTGSMTPNPVHRRLDSQNADRLAAALQPAAKRLEYNQRRISLSASLTARRNREELMEAGVLYSQQMAPQLQSSGVEVEAALRAQVSRDYLQRMGILREDGTSTAPTGTGGVEYQPKLDLDRKRRLSTELNSALATRATQEDLMNMNILHSVAMARSIQGPASDLEQLLHKRQPQEQLKQQGILPYGSQMDGALMGDAARLEKLLRAQQQHPQDQSVAPALQAAARQLENAQKRDAVSSGLQHRGTAEQSGVDTNLAPAIQAAARALDAAQKKDAVSSGLQRRGDASEYGVDGTVAPSLQAAAKQLESAQKKDAVSSGLQHRGTAEQSGVDTSIAPAIQAAARDLEKAKTKDAVASGLQHRKGTAPDVGLDQSIARSLQGNAKSLQYHLTQDQVNKELAFRHSTQHLMQQGKMYSDQMAHAIQPAAVDLEDRLHDRVGSGELQQKNILAASPNLDSSLAQQAYQVNKELSKRGDARGRGDSAIAPSLQSAAKKIKQHHRQMSLNRQVKARPDSNELLAKGVLYANQEKMSAAIQGSAISLENNLVDRPKESDLASQGIMEHSQMDPSLRATANALESKLDRNATSPKQDATGSAPALQSAIKALEFQQKELQLKRLLKNQDPSRRESHQVRFGIDAGLAPSLQNAAKQLELSQRKDKLNSKLAASTAAKEEYRENEHGIYNLGLANSLRETAQQLAKQKQRDTLERSLNSRTPREELLESQILFDDSISPAIQSQAMQLAQQLDYLRKKGMISSLLDSKKEIRKQYGEEQAEPPRRGGHVRSGTIALQNALKERPDGLDLVKSGILHAAPEVAHAIHDTINVLEQQLGKRLTTEQLRDLGILGSNPSMANSLQPTAAKLAGLLASQMKQEASKLASALQPAANDLERNLAKDALRQKMDQRPARQSVMAAGIMPHGAVADSIAGQAYNLQRNLNDRETSEALEKKGIIKDPQKHVKVGDHIKLNNGLTGRVKWIGISDVTNDELVGIALDYFNSMATDGTLGNKRYFMVDEGFGMYVPREDIAQYVTAPRPLASQAEVDGLNQKNRQEEEMSMKERKRRVKEIRVQLAEIGKIEAKAKEYGTFTVLSDEERKLVGTKSNLEQKLEDLTRRRLSLTLENAIVKRPTPEQMLERGVLKSFDISPALQSAAYLLESKLRRRKSLDEVAMQRLFGQEGAFSNIEEMGVEFDKAINFLTDKISRRPSVTTMQELNILKAAQTVIAPRLQSARDELESKLRRRPSVADMQMKGFLPNHYDLNRPYNENMEYMEDKKTLDDSHRRSILQNSLRRRPTLEAIAAAGLFKSKDAQYSADRRRRSIELELNDRLQRRPSIDKLEHQGILPYGHTPLAASQQKLQRRRLSMTLKEKLQARVAREVLQEMGVLMPHQDINFSRNLGPAAASLTKKLRRRPSLENIGNIYRTPDQQESHSREYQSLRDQLDQSMRRRPTMSHMIQKDVIKYSSMDDYDITIRRRPAGIRFSEGANFIGLYVDEVRPGSVPEALGVSKNDLLVAINAYNVERLHSNKVINLFRTMKLPMHVRFRRNGKAAHSERIAGEMASGAMVDNNEDSDVSPLQSPRESSNNVINDAVIASITKTIMARTNEAVGSLTRQLDALVQSKQQSDKQQKKMSRTLDLMKTEINSLRIEKVRWKQESDRLAKANSDLVDRILVLDHELEQMKAEMARLDGEYSVAVNKRPIGVTWSHANNRTQLKVAAVSDSTLAELFNVESGDVLMSINNHNVENIDSDRVQTWFEKCPLPMKVTFRRKEANLELERAKYALEKQRQEIWDRLNAKSDGESDEESDYTESEDDDSDAVSDDEKDAGLGSMNRSGSVKLHKKATLSITKPGLPSGSSERAGAAMMTQKSLRRMPTTPRSLITPKRGDSLTQDITEMVIKSDMQQGYQGAAIDALELEMKLELERLQKYNETGEEVDLMGGLTPAVSNNPPAAGQGHMKGMGSYGAGLTPTPASAHHHRLATLEMNWDSRKETAPASGAAAGLDQFSPQQLAQIQKLLQQQAQQSQVPAGQEVDIAALAALASHEQKSGADVDASVAAAVAAGMADAEKPKKKKKKIKKSKGIGAIASRFE